MKRYEKLILLAALVAGASGAAPAAPAVPRYDHVVVVVEENKGYSTILERGLAPNLTRLAKEYGSARQMFAEVHPSEGNYVALLGGDTYGINDDDAWYCVPASARPFCSHANAPGYPAHLIDAPNLGTQLRAKGLDWRAYLEDIPQDGSDAIISTGTATRPPALYAAKHTGFTNFKSTIEDPQRAEHLVGFDAWRRDLSAGALPAFSLVIPNQCNEMHGIDANEGNGVPADCADPSGAIARGDRVAAQLVAAIQASPAWASGNTAIVITWDEDGGADRVAGAVHSCCVVDAHNPGGGHIATIVITNHGPRGVSDDTPYDHYSLLRTIEDAFGLDHLRHAGDDAVVPMVPLFGPLVR